jgi:hypothetical protein
MTTPRVCWSACLTLTLLLIVPRLAAAQVLGTFRWQLQPYCNVVTLTVTQNGTIYALDGTDDQCSAAGPRAAATGVAFSNPDGSIGIGLNIVGVPGGAPVHVDATIGLATLSGTWRDSAGGSGAFVSTPGTGTGGSPRPSAGLGSASVNAAQIQLRIAGTCASGQMMTAVNQNGTVACATPAGGGDITAVNAGPGLTGGATTGDATLSVVFAGTGTVAAAARADHTHDRPNTSTSVGASSLAVQTTGGNNTAVGYQTLFLNSTGVSNTAMGTHALAGTSSSSYNTAVGDQVLRSLTSGRENTGVGFAALELMVTGSRNTAMGSGALARATGGSNTAIGWGALPALVTGEANVAVGESTLYSSITSGANVAVGSHALFALNNSVSNVAVGPFALQSLTSGNYNIALGLSAGLNVATGTSNMYLGNEGVNGENNTVRVGSGITHSRMFLAATRGVTTGLANATTVVIDSNGQLGTLSSSRRFKRDIEDLGAVREMVQQLRPVRFRYLKPFDDGSTPVQYGLIAEEVAQVVPMLVVEGADGQPESVKYHVLPTLLLAEVQRLERERASTTAQLEAQAAELADLRAMVVELRRALVQK